MSTVHLIWEYADGSVLKGLVDCDSADPDTKQMVDSDLKFGQVQPGQTSAPQAYSVRPFSWIRNGDPANPITDFAVYLDEYYSTDPAYVPDSGKTFCDGASTAVFGDYTDANGSNSPAFDKAKLLEWGDAGTGGLEISLDRGKTYTRIKTGVGDSIANALPVPATALDVGSVDGQIDPGDRAMIYARVTIPATYTDGAGVYLWTLGSTFNFTE